MILFLDLVLFLVAALLLLGFVTQVAIPLVRGTVIFPFFRPTPVTKQVAEAEHKLEELTEAEQLRKLQDEIKRREARLKETK